MMNVRIKKCYNEDKMYYKIFCTAELFHRHFILLEREDFSIQKCFIYITMQTKILYKLKIRKLKLFYFLYFYLFFGTYII